LGCCCIEAWRAGYLPIEALFHPNKLYDPYQIVPPFVEELKRAIAQRV
jgi:hypothetical protein